MGRLKFQRMHGRLSRSELRIIEQTKRGGEEFRQLNPTADKDRFRIVPLVLMLIIFLMLVIAVWLLVFFTT